MPAINTIFYFGNKFTYVDKKLEQQPPPPVKHLSYSSITSCCGAGFMAFFPKPDITNYLDKKIVKEVEVQLENEVKSFNSMMLVILNNLQKPHYDEMLKKVGFRIVMDHVYHPTHGHDLTLYGWQKYEKSSYKSI